MVTVGMNYEIIEGKDEAFVKKFSLVLDVMGKTEGHLKTNLYRDVYKERSYLIVSEWKTKPAFEAFTSSEVFKKTTDWGKESILAGRPRHEIYGDEAAAPLSGECPAS